MQRCDKCHLEGDESSFYPDNKVCKLCITTIRKTRLKEVVETAQKLEREQLAFRTLIKQFQSNYEPYVYLIEASDRYKIGFSTNIDARLRAFNTANSVACKIIAIAPGGKWLEKLLHTKLDVHRINREWFSHSSAILREFKKLEGVMIFLQGQMKMERFAPSCDMDGSSSQTPAPPATL